MASTSADQTTAKQERSPLGKPKFKSYRKKFFKIRAQFTKVMSENNTLWDSEQNLRRVARRLEEELDQLRELMMDVNESEFSPKHLLVNLDSSRPSENALLQRAGVLKVDKDLERILRDQSNEYDEAEGYCTMVKEYRSELRKGDATLADYRTAYKTALPYQKIIRSLGYLEDKVSHTRREGLSSSHLLTEFAQDDPVGYMGAQQEQEYLERLDAEVAERMHTIAKAPGLGPPPMPPPPPNYPGKDNPMSALNWLRKHQPQDFLPEGEAPPEKATEESSNSKKSQSQAAAAAAAATSTPSHSTPAATDRRTSRAKRGSLMQEVLDDEGFVIGHEPASRGRGKRKRPKDDDDDVAYHPSKGSGRKKRKSALELAAERD